MIIVVDTNIIFSGILSAKGTISDLLLNSSDIFEFYSPSSILEELDNHHQKIISVSGLLEKDVLYLRQSILKRIELIDLENIPEATWQKAIDLTKDVDEDDTPLNSIKLLEAPLWTGDKKLADGLIKKGVDWILDTKQLAEIRNEKQ